MALALDAVQPEVVLAHAVARVGAGALGGQQTSSSGLIALNASRPPGRSSRAASGTHSLGRRTSMDPPLR